MKTNKRIRLILAALLSLNGVLPAAAADYQAADYLPLAVGNSWTYGHDYYDQGIDALHDSGTALYPAYYQWPTFDESSHYPSLPIFTIRVKLRAVLGGRTVKYEDLLTPTNTSSSSWGQVKKEVQ
ncbi:MAG: hypothetical protein OXI58_06000 [Gemmatimonadota bacterium]|nr:hypothetical protein [Gemmatimonadota bacterium]